MTYEITKSKFTNYAKRQIYNRAKGYCELCGKKVSDGQIAHIISVTPDGPRSYTKIFEHSELFHLPTLNLIFNNSPRNGLYLCYECHRKIDTKQNEHIYTVELLTKMRILPVEYSFVDLFRDKINHQTNFFYNSTLLNNNISKADYFQYENMKQFKKLMLNLYHNCGSIVDFCCLKKNIFIKLDKILKESCLDIILIKEYTSHFMKKFTFLINNYIQNILIYKKKVKSKKLHKYINYIITIIHSLCFYISKLSSYNFFEIQSIVLDCFNLICEIGKIRYYKTSKNFIILYKNICYILALATKQNSKFIINKFKKVINTLRGTCIKKIANYFLLIGQYLQLYFDPFLIEEKLLNDSFIIKKLGDYKYILICGIFKTCDNHNLMESLNFYILNE